MGRLAPEGFLRLRQALPGSLALTFGGAESNVAASLAQLGASSRLITALPQNALADACVGFLSGLGVDTSCILRTETGRLGLYFYESGANQRPSRVIYDREHSSVSLCGPDAYDWNKAFAQACWLHTTGITPALSRQAANTVRHALETARKNHLTVSCDLNFRKKLWNWEPGTDARALAERTLRELLPLVDLLIANEEDASDILGITASDTDVERGQLSISHYPAVAREIIRQFPNISKVAITLRESRSASHNAWGAMLYDRQLDQAFFSPETEGRYTPYQIKNIVDRVGGGDSFGAALIFALNTPELSQPADAIAFAAAASCLCHSIVGDINFSSRAEVEALMKGSGAGRVVR